MKYHVWMYRRERKGYQIVLVSTLTGDIKEYAEIVRDRRTAERRIAKLNADKPTAV